MDKVFEVKNLAGGPSLVTTELHKARRFAQDLLRQDVAFQVRYGGRPIVTFTSTFNKNAYLVLRDHNGAMHYSDEESGVNRDFAFK